MYKKRHLARHTFVDDLILFRCHCNDHATDFGNEARLFVMLEHFSAFKRARAVSVGLLLVARRAEATRSRGHVRSLPPIACAADERAFMRRTCRQVHFSTALGLRSAHSYSLTISLSVRMREGKNCMP